MLLSSPPLVHLEIIRRSYVVSDTTALPRGTHDSISVYTLLDYLHFVTEIILGLHNHRYSIPEPCLTEVHFGLGHRLPLSSDPTSLKPLFLPQAT